MFTRKEIESVMSCNSLQGIANDYNKKAPKIKVKKIVLINICTEAFNNANMILDNLSNKGEVIKINSNKNIVSCLKLIRRIEIKAEKSKKEKITIRRSEFELLEMFE